MPRCPSCGARREESDDYCPVCGETLTEVHFSEATGVPWYERTGFLWLLVLLVWPIGLYGVYRRDGGSRRSDALLVGAALGMALLWGVLF